MNRKLMFMYIGTITGFAVTIAYTINVCYAIMCGGVVNFDVNKYGEMYPELMLLVVVLSIQFYCVQLFYRKKVMI